MMVSDNQHRVIETRLQLFRPRPIRLLFSDFIDSNKAYLSNNPLYKSVFFCLLLTILILDVYAHYGGVLNTGV